MKLHVLNLTAFHEEIVEQLTGVPCNIECEARSPLRVPRRERMAPDGQILVTRRQIPDAILIVCETERILASRVRWRLSRIGIRKRVSVGPFHWVSGHAQEALIGMK